MHVEEDVEDDEKKQKRQENLADGGTWTDHCVAALGVCVWQDEMAKPKTSCGKKMIKSELNMRDKSGF